eukprot:gene46270-56650_t
MIEEQVQQEMARARQDMQAEGARLEREEQELKEQQLRQLQQEKLRKMKWACVTIQAYMRSFLARKASRRACYARFRKHFSADDHEYYYEDTRTGETRWAKPWALGSYDLDMEPCWVLMLAHRRAGDAGDEGGEGFAQGAGSTGFCGVNLGGCLGGYRPELMVDEGHGAPLSYFYNPATWEMRWAAPPSVAFCSRCAVDLASALLRGEEAVYCLPCLHARCAELVASGADARYLFFKWFQGGREDAAALPLAHWGKDISYFAFTNPLDPAARGDGKPSGGVSAKAGMSSKSAKSGKSGKSARAALVYCDVCSSDENAASGGFSLSQRGAAGGLWGAASSPSRQLAQRHCEDCDRNFCRACCKAEHRSRLKKFHFLI